MSYILPIGVGISGSQTSFGGASYGMNIYRRNSVNDPAKIPENGSNNVINGSEKPYGKGTPPYSNYSNGKLSPEADRKRRFDSFECQTCKNRKYQDGSDDSGVSFQTPTKVDPKAAASAVRSHEQEHVSRNRSKAQREGREIVSQTVTIHTGICPECGRVYVSGGTTRTTTRDASNKDNFADKFAVGITDPSMDSGNRFSAVA